MDRNCPFCRDIEESQLHFIFVCPERDSYPVSFGDDHRVPSEHCHLTLQKLKSFSPIAICFKAFLRMLLNEYVVHWFLRVLIKLLSDCIFIY